MKTEICSQVCLICVFLQSHIHVTFFAVYALEQCFPTFFCLQHTNLAMKTFRGTPSWLYRYKDQGIVPVGSTIGNSSRYPSVPWHTGWESLL